MMCEQLDKVRQLMKRKDQSFLLKKSERYKARLIRLEGSHQTCNFILKKSLAQVFSCEFCKISKNTFFKEHLWTTASSANIFLSTITTLTNPSVKPQGFLFENVFFFYDRNCNNNPKKMKSPK